MKELKNLFENIFGDELESIINQTIDLSVANQDVVKYFDDPEFFTSVETKINSAKINNRLSGIISSVEGLITKELDSIDDKVKTSDIANPKGLIAKCTYYESLKKCLQQIQAASRNSKEYDTEWIENQSSKFAAVNDIVLQIIKLDKKKTLEGLLGYFPSPAFDAAKGVGVGIDLDESNDAESVEDMLKKVKKPSNVKSIEVRRTGTHIQLLITVK